MEGTPTSCQYELRSRTPGTPSTPLTSGPLTPSRRVLRSTPRTGDNIIVTTPLKNTPSTPLKATPLKATPLKATPLNVPLIKGTPSSPIKTTKNTPIKGTPCTPTMERLQGHMTPGSGDKRKFRTPMTYKPRLQGNKPVPSPSKQEIWKQQLGLTDEASGSDKENTSDDEENQPSQANQVEFRALQKELALKNAERDDNLLFIKSCKDKLRQYKARQEREESMKQQQMKILRRTHETQLEERDRTIDNLHAIITELEDQVQELENSAVATPRKRATRSTKAVIQEPVKPATSVTISKLVDDVKRLQGENQGLAGKLADLQLEMTALAATQHQQLEPAGSTGNSTPARNCQQEDKNVCTDMSGVDTDRLAGLQAENRQLHQDLTESRNSHTKALTVSKLAAHRQQQVEEELTRLKARCASLEKEVSSHAGRHSDAEEVRAQLSSVSEENVKLQASTRDLQAQIFTLQSRSPEVQIVKKQVESESLRKKYDSCKAELQQTKSSLDTQKQELHKAQTRIRYLDRMLKVTEEDKNKADSNLWSELETLNTEHQAALAALRETLATQAQQDLAQCESRLTSEHKKELQSVIKSLNDKHCQEIKTVEDQRSSLKTQYEHQVSSLESQLEQEKCRLTAESDKLRDECNALQGRLESEAARLEREKTESHEHWTTKCHQLEEDMTIAKTAAVNRVREEMHSEMHNRLHDLEQRLKLRHADNISQLKADHCQELTEAVEQERRSTAERMKLLEERHRALCSQLTDVQTAQRQMLATYMHLQKQVAHMPKMIQSTVTSTTKQVTGAIKGVSDYNQQLVKQYHKEMKLRKKYHNELVELKGNIRVFCRVRPVIAEDGGGQSATNIVSVDPDDSGVLYVRSKARSLTFEVDRVFDEHSTQTQVFDEAKSLITSCIDGFNVCIFAYGQTGSGKTYTMEGTETDAGINQRALALLFEETAQRADWKYTITVSVIEIYNEMIRDLLGEETSYKMEVKMNPEGGHHIPGLCFIHVTNVEEVNQCFRLGQQNRATAATNMNEHSSRSHCLLCVTVVGYNKMTATRTTGKLNLVDLAGSERVSKSQADGERLKEAKCINTSLSALGNVISALRTKANHVPYRNSKLTYLLQDSLGGDSKTLMIAQVAPVKKNEGETICSLNFAQRVRTVELGQATQRLENGDGTEEAVASPARTVSTPHRTLVSGRTGTPGTSGAKPGTPASGRPLNGTPGGVKPATPSSTSKLTPARQTRVKNTDKF